MKQLLTSVLTILTIIIIQPTVFANKRPDIKEIKLCSAINMVIDNNLKIMDGCNKLKPYDLMSLKRFPILPRVCTHLCYEDYSRELYNKVFLYSEDKNFRYNADIKDTNV